jgi:glutamate dehydrogenase/leucine dehydrogenase
VALYNPKGIDVKKAEQHVLKKGNLRAFDEGDRIDPNEMLIMPCDVLVPSAVDRVINGKNAAKLQCRILAEGANGPTTPEADKVIQDRDIFVIPDFLANAGGVTCSYFEQVQSNMNHYWTQDEVLGKLDVKMTHAFHDVAELARSRKLAMRDAAYVIAVSRVAKACRDRGWV